MLFRFPHHGWFIIKRKDLESRDYDPFLEEGVLIEVSATMSRDVHRMKWTWPKNESSNGKMRTFFPDRKWFDPQ